MFVLASPENVNAVPVANVFEKVSDFVVPAPPIRPSIVTLSAPVNENNTVCALESVTAALG